MTTCLRVRARVRVRELWRRFGRVLAFAIALFASVTTTHARAEPPKPAQAQPLERIDVIVPRENLQYLSFWVAKGAGFFAAEGIDFAIVSPEIPAGTAQMVEKNQADVFVLSPPIYLQLMADKYPLLLVANLLQNDPIDVIVKRSVFDERHMNAKAPLKERLESLRGLRIGVAPGPPKRMRALFASEGLDADEMVKMVILHGKEQNEAFGKGDVDALYCHTPWLEKALVDQDGVMLVNQSGGEVKALASRQIHALVVTRKFEAARRDKVFAMVRAIYQAEKLIHANRAAAVDAVMTALPTLDRKKVETVVAIYEPAIPDTPKVSIDGLNPALALFPASKPPPDLSKIAYHEYVAPAFAERAVSDAMAAAAPPTPMWKRTRVQLAAAAVALAIVAIVAGRIRRPKRAA